ncbi:cobyrinate a,c-diamide synthase [Thalassospira sp. MA62]|nr:cobyrinate a,c-diamide synthase [Thalassospira sp. MA62]
MPDQMPGLVIAAPASNSGKTVITLAILRALKRRGMAVAAAKTGPDYIDPAFQGAACGTPCLNLDPWAMSGEQISELVTRHIVDRSFLLCEGVMGLFDGAANGNGSTADLAAQNGWPVILVLDVKGQSASAAAVIAGFAALRDDVTVAGVILNRVGSDRHKQMIVDACARHVPDIPILGAVRRSDDLKLPERHLGLVQAGEHDSLDVFLNRASDIIATDVDLDALCAVAENRQSNRIGRPDDDKAGTFAPLAPLGQHIAVARDRAFAFTYHHVLDGWQQAGARISFFSPLENQGPDSTADAVYLPGGYPELHAGALANADAFKAGMDDARDRSAVIYGECGGYMTLGRGLVDADGTRHQMLGMLALETSFQQRKLHLGYRVARLNVPTPFGPTGTILRGHEFHYATTLLSDGPAMCQATNATGNDLGPAGLADGRVFGSFFHAISRQ